jgi:hypothetical protein
MKIGQSDSIEAITPAHWQKMTQETRMGWPLVRERLAQLAQKAIDALREPGVRSAGGNDAIGERVAGIIEERAFNLLRDLQRR